MMFHLVPPLYVAFTSEHPEHANQLSVETLADGTEDLFVPADTIAAFFRWCLANGYGDADKIVEFLTETLPSYMP